MNDQERFEALHSIIDLCRPAHFILGHSDKLLKMEDDPEVVGLGGIVSGIETPPHRICDGIPPL